MCCVCFSAPNANVFIWVEIIRRPTRNISAWVHCCCPCQQRCRWWTKQADECSDGHLCVALQCRVVTIYNTDHNHHSEPSRGQWVMHWKRKTNDNKWLIIATPRCSHIQSIWNFRKNYMFACRLGDGVHSVSRPPVAQHKKPPLRFNRLSRILLGFLFCFFFLLILVLMFQSWWFCSSLSEWQNTQIVLIHDE